MENKKLQNLAISTIVSGVIFMGFFMGTLVAATKEGVQK